jgi:peptidoglycan glycosyltransferase
MVFKDLRRIPLRIIFSISTMLLCQYSYAQFNFLKDNALINQSPQTPESEVSPESKPQIEEWSQIMDLHQSWDQQIEYDSSKYRANYTFDDGLEDFIKRQLNLYHPDYSSVVVIDNETGNVLAAVDHSREKKVFGRDLAFSTTHPAASVIKVITAADLLENTHINTHTEFAFAGRSTTLYRSQLKEPPQQKRRNWVRRLDLDRAFATSNNVIFGRTAIENLTPHGLKKMAERFGFNKRLVEGVNVHPSVFPLAEDQYNFAELASGFNTKTLMSPIHGAVIGSIVANGGILKYPIVIKSVDSISGKKTIYPPMRPDEQVLTPQTAEDMRHLFMSTVTSGTARSSFRRSKLLLTKYEIGGKTGSMTGGTPFGKRDWFVSYAKSIEEKNDKGISICVMLVNQKKWYVKSPLLAKNIIEYYYDNIYPQKK